MNRKLMLLVAVLALPVAALAQIVFPPPAPVPTPVLTVPTAGAAVKGEIPALTSLDLNWIEYGLFATPLQPLPSYFVVCLKLPAAPACTFAAADFKPVGSLPSITVFSGFQAVGYQYTLKLAAGSVPDSLVDVDSTWSVGACRNAAAASCVFAPARSLRISSRDLNVEQIKNNSSSTHAIFLARSRNGGTSTISSVLPFKTSVIAWDALQDPATGKCRKDIDSMDVRADPNVIVFMDDGRTAWMTTLPEPNGVRKAPALVVGMHRWNGGFTVLGAEQQFVFDLPAGRVADAAELRFLLPAAQRPKPFVVRVLVDSRGVVREFDENNNFGASCEFVP